MIRYTVVWEEGAQAELAELWLRAQDRRPVAGAANLIDRELAENARSKGTEVSEGLRAFDAPPFRVLFNVRDDDRIVEVVRVRPE